MLNEIETVFLVEMDEGLGITMCSKAVAPLLEILAQVDVIEDFPVENDPDLLIFIAKGLMASREINYR